MEILTVAGTVTRDAVLRNTSSGTPVLSFSVVVDQGKDKDGNRRDGHFFDASVWGKRATALASHIKKGDKLTVSGRPTARAHEGKAYLGVNVDQLTFQGGGQPSSARGGSEPASEPAYGGGDMDDEIPF